MISIRYAIEYENLREELVVDDRTKWLFNEVKNNANKYKLELSDEEFNGFFRLLSKDKDIWWIMRGMSKYNASFAEMLVSYITY